MFPSMTSRLRLVRVLGSVIVVASAALGGVLALGDNGHAGPPHAGCGRHTNPCRVLFVGNSYTYVNQLPSTFELLAYAGDRSVEVEMVADGGESLADHVGSEDVKEALRSAKWNIVVLQEESVIPASQGLRQSQMYPAARELVDEIRAAGAQPMFFATWAHRDGWPENGLRTYASMQSAVDAGYTEIARDLHVAVAPVGDVWAAALAEAARARRLPGLWVADGSHPTRRGTYLAACVFYAAIFQKSPVGLPYRDGIVGKEAPRLQAIASHIVLGG
jgi:hypothetical protein